MHLEEMKRTGILLLITLFLGTVIRAQGWQMLGIGSNPLKVNGTISALCIDSGGIVYAAGDFTDSPDVYHGSFYVAKWDGAVWSRVGLGSDTIFRNGSFSSMCTDAAHNLYAAGSIRDANGKWYVAKWDGISWSELGVGDNALNANSSINTICSDRAGNIYAAGAFTDSPSNITGHRYVAKWDGVSWSRLGTGGNALNADGNIWSVIVSGDGYVYAGGDFREVPGSGYSYVAMWNGTTWSSLGTGANALNAFNIWKLCTDPAGNIYAAAEFVHPIQSYVAKWDGFSWSELGSGGNSLNANYPINSIASDASGNIYAAGSFTELTSAYHYLAQWNGNKWNELGTGAGALNANGAIFSICVDPAFNVYAAGDFNDSVVGYGRRYVARFHDPTAGIILKSPGLSGVNVYPNPTLSNITVAVASALVGSCIILADLSGNVIYNGQLSKSENTIDLSCVPSGLYELEIISDLEGAKRVSIIKN